jgi:hypothetical protein
MTEADIMRQLQIDASEMGARLFRQNSGVAWIGKAEAINCRRNVAVYPGDVIVRNARVFHAGMKGMSDLGGWSPVVVSADMIGATLAVYTQVEVKKNGRLTPEQSAWIDRVRLAGGLAGVARSRDDLKNILFG